MSEQPSSAANQSTTQSAGDMLRSARERKGLSIEQAAAHLNLRPSLVTDLENEHYEQLRIPTYRRGYLRAYARLLEIDPEQVLKAHDEKHGKADEPIKVSTPIKPLKRPSRIGKVAFWIITIIIVLLIIGLTTQWWKNRNGNDFNTQGNNTPGAQLPDQSSPASTAPQSSTNGNAANTQGNSAQASNQTNNQANNASVNNAKSGSTSANTSTSQANTGTQGNGASNNNGSNDLQMQVGNGVDGANMTTSEAESESRQNQSNNSQNGANQNAVGQNANAQNQNGNSAGSNGQNGNNQNSADTAAATSSNGIALQFNRQSWTRITDARGHTLLSGLQQAGSQRTITGQAPFHLVIGNATGVSVTYKGQPVHLGARNVARLTLGN